MPVRRLVAAVLLPLLAAGCLEGATSPGGNGPDEEWYLGGAWTTEHTQADIDAWCEVARAYDNECLIMESYPPQFGLRFKTQADCNAARAEILALEHITVRECHRIVPSDDPDGSTSSPAAGARSWSLRGSFARGYSAADLEAWCGLAEELGQTCALMKSEPPQYAWSFDDLSACEHARTRLLALANVTAQQCVSA